MEPASSAELMLQDAQLACCAGALVTGQQKPCRDMQLQRRSSSGRPPRARPSGYISLYSVFAPLGWGALPELGPPGWQK